MRVCSVCGSVCESNYGQSEWQHWRNNHVKALALEMDHRTRKGLLGMFIWLDRQGWLTLPHSHACLLKYNDDDDDDKDGTEEFAGVMMEQEEVEQLVVLPASASVSAADSSPLFESKAKPVVVKGVVGACKMYARILETAIAERQKGGARGSTNRAASACREGLKALLAEAAVWRLIAEGGKQDMQASAVVNFLEQAKLTAVTERVTINQLNNMWREYAKDPSCLPKSSSASEIKETQRMLDEFHRQKYRWYEYFVWVERTQNRRGYPEKGVAAAATGRKSSKKKSSKAPKSSSSALVQAEDEAADVEAKRQKTQ